MKMTSIYEYMHILNSLPLKLTILVVYFFFKFPTCRFHSPSSGIFMDSLTMKFPRFPFTSLLKFLESRLGWKRHRGIIFGKFDFSKIGINATSWNFRTELWRIMKYGREFGINPGGGGGKAGFRTISQSATVIPSCHTFFRPFVCIYPGVSFKLLFRGKNCLTK